MTKYRIERKVYTKIPPPPLRKANQKARQKGGQVEGQVIHMAPDYFKTHNVQESIQPPLSNGGGPIPKGDAEGVPTPLGARVPPSQVQKIYDYVIKRWQGMTPDEANASV